MIEIFLSNRLGALSALSALSALGALEIAKTNDLH